MMLFKLQMPHKLKCVHSWPTRSVSVSQQRNAPKRMEKMANIFCNRSCSGDKNLNRAKSPMNKKIISGLEIHSPKAVI